MAAKDPLHGKMAGAALVQDLQREPMVPDEMSYDHPTLEQREIVRKLQLPATRHTNECGIGCSGTRTVYYLHGDERRAVRVFIDELTDVVEEHLEHRGGGVFHRWDDYMYRLLREEWQFYKRGDD